MPIFKLKNNMVKPKDSPEYWYIILGDDIIFTAANSMFTLATGERRCFNVTIVDDDEIETNENFRFEFEVVNTSLTRYSFHDATQIIVRDNEGQ